MKFVRKIAQKIFSKLKLKHVSTLEIEDLYSYGYIGLIQAKQRFEKERNVSFTTYSYPRIRGAIYDGLRVSGYVSVYQYNNLKDKIKFVPFKPYRFVDEKQTEKRTRLMSQSFKLKSALSVLNSKEQSLLIDVYVNQETLTKWAERNNLGRSRACRLHKEILNKLSKEIFG